LFDQITLKSKKKKSSLLIIIKVDLKMIFAAHCATISSFL